MCFLCFSVRAQSGETVVARVDGNNITQREVDDSVGSQIYALEQQLFTLRNTALNNLVSRKVLEIEAARQNISIEQLKSKWMAGDVKVDASEVEDLFQKNRSAFRLLNPDEAKEKLRIDLEGQVRLKRYREALNAVRQNTRIEILLDEPRLRLMRGNNVAASKGRSDARVVITEFSDFQCPYCKQVQATLKEVLKQHSDDVRLEFKHLPLEGHPFALTAARSAFCAGKQGVFWEFHDELFNSSSISQQTIAAIAAKLRLQQKEFDVCLTSPESQAAVTRDLQEARRLGLDGTPSFIINGKPFLGAASLEEFNEAIARELNRLTTQNLNLSKVKEFDHE
jgi:protein-disulfide isomerase